MSVAETLTNREVEVCRLVLDGKTSKEIGRALGLSHRTVECYRARITEKTGTRAPAVWLKALESENAA